MINCGFSFTKFAGRKKVRILRLGINYFLFQDHSQLEFSEEEGTARLGFVQLNSGSTSFNTTLNLTGPILLGMGIAAATLFYAYFNAFQG